MINFFWQFFGDLNSFRGVIDLAISLIVSISWLLGFRSSASFFKDHKALGTVMWFLSAGAIVGLSCIMIFVGFLAGSHGGGGSGLSAGNVAYVLSFSVGFMLFTWLGYKFVPKKIIHWLFVSLVFVCVNFGILAYEWARTIEPFGTVYDKELTELSLNDGAGFDYEISIMEAIERENVSRLLRIRVRGDSAYYQEYSQKQTFVEYVFAAGWVSDAEEMRANADSIQWSLLDSPKTSEVKKLKKRIASYEQEFSSRRSRLKDFCTVFFLDDFKKKKRKGLAFCNANSARVYDAVTIEDMYHKLRP